MNCSKCDIDYSDSKEIKFCPKCGTELVIKRSIIVDNSDKINAIDWDSSLLIGSLIDKKESVYQNGVYKHCLVFYGVNNIPGELLPLVGGKHINTIVFRTNIGTEFDLTNYANIVNIFIWFYDVKSVESVKKEYSYGLGKDSKVNVTEIKSKCNITKDSTNFVIDYKCDPYTVEITNSRYGKKKGYTESIECPKLDHEHTGQ